MGLPKNPDEYWNEQADPEVGDELVRTIKEIDKDTLVIMNSSKLPDPAERASVGADYYILKETAKVLELAEKLRPLIN